MAAYEKVEIEWIDSVVLNSGGWMDPDEIDSELDGHDMAQHTTGYVIRESARVLAIASSFNPQQVGQVTLIPKAAIRDRTQLGAFSDRIGCGA